MELKASGIYIKVYHLQFAMLQLKNMQRALQGQQTVGTIGGP